MTFDFGIVRYTLAEPVVITLRQYRQRDGENETGGVLAGWEAAASGEWTVSHLSLPSHKNRSGRTWFQLNRGVAQRFLAQIYENSRGTVYFCGFWHTHPEPVACRSGPDVRVVADLFRNSQLDIMHQLGLIVGTSGAISAWCQARDGRIRESIATSAPTNSERVFKYSSHLSNSGGISE